MTMGSVFAFDIETVPDVEFGREKHGLEGLSDKQIGYVMQTRQREQTGSERLSIEQHRVVAVALAMRGEDGFRSWSLGEDDSTEDELVRLFFDAIGRFTPTLVSWNGAAFDLPVLQCRAMRHFVQAHRFWESGEDDASFRRNNYFNRFHWRHVDLKDVLSGFQGRSRTSLDDMAQLLGLPGRMGMTAEDVWAAHLDGRPAEIRNHCEMDAINTYLVYLRFELMRGRLSHEEHDRECGIARQTLEDSKKPHLREFLAAWPAAGL